MSTKDLQFNCFPFLVPYGEKPSFCLKVVYVHMCTYFSVNCITFSIGMQENQMLM